MKRSCFFYNIVFNSLHSIHLLQCNCYLISATSWLLSCICIYINYIYSEIISKLLLARGNKRRKSEMERMITWKIHWREPAGLSFLVVLAQVCRRWRARPVPAATCWTLYGNWQRSVFHLPGRWPVRPVVSTSRQAKATPVYYVINKLCSTVNGELT